MNDMKDPYQTFLFVQCKLRCPVCFGACTDDIVGEKEYVGPDGEMVENVKGSTMESSEKDVSSTTETIIANKSQAAVSPYIYIYIMIPSFLFFFSFYFWLQDLPKPRRWL
jgi:hypothetical protein